MRATKDSACGLPVETIPWPAQDRRALDAPPATPERAAFAPSYSYPFAPLTTIPWTKSRWAKKNVTSTGSIARKLAAIR